VISTLGAALGQSIRDDDEIVERKERHVSAGAFGRRRQQTHVLEPLERERGECALGCRAVDRDAQVEQLDQGGQALAPWEAALEIRDLEDV
jgi:hypothetical protein